MKNIAIETLISNFEPHQLKKFNIPIFLSGILEGFDFFLKVEIL